MDNCQGLKEITEVESSRRYLKLAQTHKIGRMTVRKERDNLLKYDAVASISYALGVVFSCFIIMWTVYPRKPFPWFFCRRSPKKIGIRSEDLKNLLEKTMRGSALALSSPRLVMPAAIYGLWGLSHNFFSGLFDFQLVPAMFGLFAYKAAALVQVYTDNEDLRFIFSDNEGSE